jgi:hypothetical protein
MVIETSASAPSCVEVATTCNTSPTASVVADPDRVQEVFDAVVKVTVPIWVSAPPLILLTVNTALAVGNVLKIV